MRQTYHLHGLGRHTLEYSPYGRTEYNFLPYKVESGRGYVHDQPSQQLCRVERLASPGRGSFVPIERHTRLQLEAFER